MSNLIFDELEAQSQRSAPLLVSDSGPFRAVAHPEHAPCALAEARLDDSECSALALAFLHAAVVSTNVAAVAARRRWACA